MMFFSLYLLSVQSFIISKTRVEIEYNVSEIVYLHFVSQQILFMYRRIFY